LLRLGEIDLSAVELLRRDLGLVVELVDLCLRVSDVVRLGGEAGDRGKEAGRQRDGARG